MTPTRAFQLFHLLVLLVFAGTGLRFAGFSVIVDDELRNLLTVQNIAATGSVWLTEARVALYQSQFGDRWPLPRSAVGQYGYSKHGVANLIPLVPLYLVQPRLIFLGNLPWLLLILYILRRWQRQWQRPEANYYYAALFLIFGSTVTPYWFTLYPHLFVAAMLLACCHWGSDYADTGRPAARWLAALAGAGMIISRPETVVLLVLPLLALAVRSARARRWPGLLTVGGLAALAVGYTAVLHWLRTGNPLDSGEGMFSWSADGLLGNIVQPHRNLFLTNLPLLLLFPEWRQLRRLAPALAAAISAWLLYSSWHGWHYGYMRYLQVCVVLLLPALLLVRIRPLALVLLAGGLLLNTPYFFLPLFDVAQSMGASDAVPGAWHDPWAALQLLLLLLRGLLAG
ncbi:MAG TPA: hypothetical protein PKM88_00135 [bacterium]|nr:hypothetical protein [bacterium]